MSSVTRWWFPPIALGRVAALRVLAAAYVVVDVWWLTSWAHDHGRVDPQLYRPVALARWLHLPAASPWSCDVLRVVMTIAAAVIVASTVVPRDRLVRAGGGVLSVTYTWWMLVAMSYGKVDHDRLGLLVLLAVLPTVAGARLGDTRSTDAAGWAIRMAQVAAVATYALAGIAKIRFGGWTWATGATFARAIIRRGNAVADTLLDMPQVLQVAQWTMLVAELVSPAIFLVRRERTVWCIVIGLYAFHLLTFATLGIAFFPHLVVLASFLPLERVGARRQTPSVDRATNGVALGLRE